MKALIDHWTQHWARYKINIDISDLFMAFAGPWNEHARARARTAWIPREQASHASLDF